ncbi:frv operon regulatory protein [Listeria grandensis FSL F6-0971]|uniref:Frv operon regulatory protein n=1 Tax=Listeria grandensis FSL F6-0971 TaxID=1265819 RepID=W7B6Q0_9LIST|nr:PTS sugar transporter subunit IIA [Listeria grandensis]EUJ18526.1 frv operon regulatory protein [Listeria grandensis FSL F6-0971]
MLNQRQVQIMERLENSKASGLELAKLMGTSKRTILRDISQINHLLRSIGEITSSQAGGYQLQIHERQAYRNLLHQSMYDDELILLELLRHDFRTLDDLAATLFLSKPVLSEKIVFLRAHYANRLDIKSKPNYGHYLNEPLFRKMILLANLIDKNPAFFCERLEITMNDYLHMLQIIREMDTARVYPNIHSAHLVSLVLAAMVLGDDGVALDVPKMTFLEELGISPGAHRLLHDFIETQQRKSAAITTNELQLILQRQAEQYSTPVYDMELVEQLAGHLKRSIAYPIILHDRKLHNIANIKAVYPLAFDLSITFVASANAVFGMELYDIDLIGLYFSCAMERIKQASAKVVLFSDQYAVASINKQMMEREIQTVEVIVVTHQQELQQILEQQEIKLLLNNHAMFQDIQVDVECIDIKQVITKIELQAIQDTLEKIDVRKNIRTFFPEELAMDYDNKADEDWDMIVHGICEQLVEKAVLSPDEALKIQEREQKGNNLVINHLALPHCTTQRSQAFFAVFVHLANPVQVDGTVVQNALFACVNPNVSTELKVFSYLYYVLNEHDDETILGLSNYAAFIACIEK